MDGKRRKGKDFPVRRAAVRHRWAAAPAQEGWGAGGMMGPVSLVAVLIVGGVAGWLAGRIVAGRGHGLLGNIIVGIAGAVIGGAIVPMLGLGLGVGLVQRVVTATLGAVILLGIVKILRRV